MGYHMNKGFHIIEILITLIIISILTTLSIASYSRYVTATHRLQAKSYLIRLGLQLEQYHADHHTYRGMIADPLPNPIRNVYVLQILSANEFDYLIAAIPLGRQAIDDNACGMLRLNAQGVKTISGSGNIEGCW